MFRRFRNRVDAGLQLAYQLAPVLAVDPVVILALPRGGVPVGAEIAKCFRAPLRLFMVRKLGAPGSAEFAIGAVASGGIIYLNRPVIEHLGLTAMEVKEIIHREQDELLRREEQYGDPCGMDVRGRTVVLVDDGIATGATMKVAIRALREKEPEKIVVGVPVAPASVRDEFERCADAFVTVIEPVEFFAVGEWYQDFSQTSDTEVAAILESMEHQDFAHFL